MKKLLYTFMFFVPFATHSMEEGETKERRKDVVLFSAICCGNQALVSGLLKTGASVDAVYQEKADKEFDPNFYDYLSGLKPLHMAAFNKKLVIMQTLFLNGALVDQKASRGRLPLHAALYGIRDIVQTPAIPYRSYPVHTTVNIDSICLLISSGADIAAQDDNGATLFHLLAQRAQTKNAKWWEKQLPRAVTQCIINNDLQFNEELIFSDDKGEKAQVALVSRLQNALQIKDNKNRTPYDIYSDKLFENGNNTTRLQKMVKKAWKSQLRDGEMNIIETCYIKEEEQ